MNTITIKHMQTIVNKAVASVGGNLAEKSNYDKAVAIARASLSDAEAAQICRDIIEEALWQRNLDDTRKSIQELLAHARNSTNA